MILVFGGTTEGRKAAEVLDEAGSPYYYSTKTGEQDIVLKHGVRIDGALDDKAITAFCREHDIRLIVDAAHPFAVALHQNINHAAAKSGIEVIRYERLYPPYDPTLTWINDYADVPRDIRSLLATTGVQSISKLKPLEAQGMRITYRILPRESSILLAKQQGATDDQLCYYQDGETIDVDADAILLKESGESGGFSQKVAAAKARGLRIIVLKRPELSFDYTVNGPYGLRKMVERLLATFFPLHSGLTTGTCATAAAVAEALRMLKNEMPQKVPVVLPDDETILVPVGYGEGYAYCVKEAGDDPDVTNGLQIRVALKPTLPFSKPRRFIFQAGEGVGTFTLPGFDYPPGSPAINKGPREMIERNLQAILPPSSTLVLSLKVTISVPGGTEIAKKTFNPRLGIQGGISIIGVSGIVKPFSEEAFIDSIRKCMQVAKASGTERVVINSGGKSERYVKALYPALPQQAFVEYGNYIGETLKIAHDMGIKNVTLGVMLGKAVKLAEGHLDTHSRRATMNKDFIRQMLEEADCRVDTEHITLARELWEMIPKEKLEGFCRVVLAHCRRNCQPLVPNAEITLLLIADDGTIHSL